MLIVAQCSAIPQQVVQELFDGVRQGPEVLRVRDDRGPHVPGLHGGAVPEPSVSCVDRMQKLPKRMEAGQRVQARRDSAEDFSRLNALLLFTATAWIFIPAYCSANSRQVVVRPVQRRIDVPGSNRQSARRSSAKHLIATEALRCTATAWMLIVARCSAIP